MEKMWIIYFTLGAVSMVVGMILYPYIQQFKSWCWRLTKNRDVITFNITDMEKRMSDLEQQVDNLAEVVSTRDRNRKYNTRRDVREYLAELQTK